MQVPPPASPPRTARSVGCGGDCKPSPLPPVGCSDIMLAAFSVDCVDDDCLSVCLFATLLSHTFSRLTVHSGGPGPFGAPPWGEVHPCRPPNPRKRHDNWCEHTNALPFLCQQRAANTKMPENAAPSLHATLGGCPVSPVPRTATDCPHCTCEVYTNTGRSEERREGKECRSRWPPDH